MPAGDFCLARILQDNRDVAELVRATTFQDLVSMVKRKSAGHAEEEGHLRDSADRAS